MTQAHIDHNWFNTHANDALGFRYNGAARRRACRACNSEYASRIPVRLVDGRKPPKLIVNTLEVVVGRDWRPTD